MANQQTSSKGLRAVLGAALFALGFAILFGNLDALAASVSRSFGGPEPSSMEPIPALILATSHAVQAYAFEQQGFFSVLQQFLVSFWPLILVIIGAVLLRSALQGRFARVEPAVRSPAAGER